MVRKAAFAVLALCTLPAFALRGADEIKQPVLVLLYSRFDDHIMRGLGEERLFRLFSLIETLRREHPRYPASVSCEFSGAFAQRFTETPTARGYIDRVKEAVKAGTVVLGYNGEHEPTYRNRPKARLAKEMTPEQRWLEQTTAAERFLSDYKNLVTGDPDPSRPGGLRAVREIFGAPSIIGVFAPQLGGEAPYFHQLRRWNIQAVVPGFPDPYYTMNIHGYRASATEIGAKAMIPTPEASSELFWDTNFLRASFTDTADIRGFSADEGKEALAKLLEKLDRSRVRLLQIEVCGYARYLDKWPDRTPKLFPLVWAYDHPDDPDIPNGIHAFLDTSAVQKGYADEQEALCWLLGEFLPANPGSRIVTPQDLMKMARTPLNTEVSAAVLAEAAKDWIARSSKEVNMSPTYVQAGGYYFSAADLFQLLANGLAGVAANGKPPEKVRLTHIYGPAYLESTEETFPKASFQAGEVAKAAAQLAPRLNDQTWRPVPSNAVPPRIQFGGKSLIPAQFLALMVEAYLAPSQDTSVRLRYLQPVTSPGYFFPRQTPIQDGGHIWTLRPAPLALK